MNQRWMGLLSFAIPVAACAVAPPDEGEGASRHALTVGRSGHFSTLSYNIAGLLEPFSSSRPSANTPIISCLIRDYDIVQVQEDFNYHAALYDTCDDHRHRSPTSGGMGIGSGLNTLSNFPYTDWTRVRWDACSGVDCLTSKGFTLARVRLDEGVYVDLYNLHAQAEVTEAALAARRANIQQLAAYVERESAGHAVIIMGDTNTRYTRAEDNVRLLHALGFTDVWIERIRGGAVPASGSAALINCDPNTTSEHCEIVDKVFYRSNGYVRLETLAYLVDAQRFVDANGADLSDHWPIAVDWAYTTPANRRLSDPWGGPHGLSFNDVDRLPEQPVVRTVHLRSGARVDQVGVGLATGEMLSHGGNGGRWAGLELRGDEYVQALRVCTGKHRGRTRIFHAAFTTSLGRTLAGGTATADCTTYAAPSEWQIVGFHGRAGDEVDKLGVVYAPAGG